MAWSVGFGKDVVGPLIENGASVNPYDRNHKTPLHLASSRYIAVHSLCLLLENGADVDVEDDEGLTIFQIVLSARSYRFYQTIMPVSCQINRL